MSVLGILQKLDLCPVQPGLNMITTQKDVNCDANGYINAVLDCYCVTYNEQINISEFGYYLFNCGYFKRDGTYEMSYKILSIDLATGIIKRVVGTIEPEFYVVNASLATILASVH